MSGGRFVLSVLAVIAAYSVGVYLLINWDGFGVSKNKPASVNDNSASKSSDTRIKSELPKSPAVASDERSDRSADTQTKPALISPIKKAEIKPSENHKAPPQKQPYEQRVKQNMASGTLPVVPSFDVVRIEPSGESVIAGRSEPGWDIRVEAGEKVIGKSKADRDGQWVVVPDKVLGSGKHELKLRSVSPEGERSIESKQKVRVAIKKGKNGKPRIVVAEAGKSERVIQPGKPERTVVADKKLPRISPDTGRGNLIRPESLSVGNRKNDQPKTDKKILNEVRFASSRSAKDAGPKKKQAASDLKTEQTNDRIKLNTGSVKKKQTRDDQLKGARSSTSTGQIKKKDQSKIASRPPQSVNSKSTTSPVVAEQKKVGGKQVSTVGEKSTKLSEVSTPKGQELKKKMVGDTMASKSGEKKKPAPSVKKSLESSTDNETSVEKKISKSLMKPVPVPLVSVRSADYERSVENSGFLSIEGDGLPGARIRLFLNDEQIGSTSADDGGVWRYYRNIVIKPGQYLIRAEQVDQSGKTLALARKSFERVLPKAIAITSIKSSVETKSRNESESIVKPSANNRKKQKTASEASDKPVSTARTDRELIKESAKSTAKDIAVLSRSSEPHKGKTEASTQTVPQKTEGATTIGKSPIVEAPDQKLAAKVKSAEIKSVKKNLSQEISGTVADTSDLRKDQTRKIAAIEKNIKSARSPRAKLPEQTVSPGDRAESKKQSIERPKQLKTVQTNKRASGAARKKTTKSRRKRLIKAKPMTVKSYSRQSRRDRLTRIRRDWKKRLDRFKKRRKHMSLRAAKFRQRWKRHRTR